MHQLLQRQQKEYVLAAVGAMQKKPAREICKCDQTCEAGKAFLSYLQVNKNGRL